MTQRRAACLLLPLACLATPAFAWSDTRAPWVFDLANGGSNCTSLVTVPDDTRYDVDFEADIRPQLEALCSVCHINGASGNLNMNFSNARLSLIGNNETGTPAQGDNLRVRVRPFVPTDSVLFEKVNCLNPPFGGVMPPGGGDTVQLQKLIHDWIAAGALMPGSPGGDRLSVGTFETITRPGPAP